MWSRFYSRLCVWREVVGEEKRYRVEGEAAVGKFVSGLVGVKSLGVPNGNFQRGKRPFDIKIAVMVQAAS